MVFFHLFLFTPEKRKNEELFEKIFKKSLKSSKADPDAYLSTRLRLGVRVSFVQVTAANLNVRHQPLGHFAEQSPHPELLLLKMAKMS